MKAILFISLFIGLNVSAQTKVTIRSGESGGESVTKDATLIDGSTNVPETNAVFDAVNSLTTSLASKQSAMSGTGYPKFTGTSIAYNSIIPNADLPTFYVSPEFTGSGVSSGSPFSLATTGASAGTYTNPTVTVNNKGQVTSISSGSGGSGSGGFLQARAVVGASSAPANGATSFACTSCIGKKINFFREGELQDSSATGDYTFDAATGEVSLTEPLATGERIIINAFDPSGITYGSITAVSSSGYEAETQAYIDAVEGAGGTLTSGKKNAYNSFVLALKTAGIFSTHFDFIHILAGGSEAAVKFNLVNPLNTDGAYRLTFPAGATFNSTGVATNGTTQYIQSHWIGGTAGKATSTNFHIGVYENTTTDVVGMVWGVAETATGTTMYMAPHQNGNIYYRNINTGQVSTTASTGKGWFYAEANGNKRLYRDNTLIFNEVDNGNGQTLPSVQKLVFNAYNSNTTIQSHRAAELSVITGGKALDATQRTALQTAINNLITALGI